MQRISITNPQNIIDGTAKKYYFKLRNTGGPKGDKGDKGDTGATGPQGPKGDAATVAVGSTTTLAVGQDATVENVGSIYNAVLDFGIPQGPQGPQGAKGDKGDTGAKGDTGPRGPQGEKGTNATVYIGTTTTGEPGTQASVYNSGTESNAVLNFTIPRGDVGPSVPLVQETGNSTTKAMSQNATTEALNGKQNTLTAGSNITISGNTISAKDTTYTAGDNVQINGTVISATDTTYTAGANIQIENGIISATDTTYTAGNGLNLNGTEFSADTDVLATKEDLEGYYTKPETDNLLAPKLEAEVVAELPTTGAEGKLYLTPKAHTTSTATGNPIEATVTDDAGSMESFQLDGDTYQQTYTGKNLFDGQKPDVRMNYIINDSGNEVTDSTGGYTRNYSKVLPETQYILSGLINAGTRRIYYYDNSKNFISRSDGSTGASTITFTTPANCYYVNVQFYTRTDTDTEMAKWQIEAGSQATSFEPFVGGVPSPSPDYPQPIQTVTGEQTVEIVGKNLIDPDGLELGNIDASGNDSASQQVVRSGYIRVVAGSYTLKVNNSENNINLWRYAIYDNSKTFVSANTPQAKSAAITIANNGYIRVSFYNVPWKDLTVQEIIGSQVQLELGSTASAYTPYSKQTLPLDLGTIELCKLGAYQDYIWKDGDDWKVHKATGYEKKIVSLAGIDGYSSVYGTATTSNGAFAIISPNWGSDYATTAGLAIASSVIGVYQSQNIDGNNTANSMIDGSFCQRSGTNDRVYFRFASWARSKTVDEVNQMIIDNGGIDVWYPLSTPTDATITNQALIAQLEAIRTASLGNGTNTITNSATAQNLAGDMEVGYYGYNPTNRYDKFIWLDLNNNYEQIGGE